MTHYLDHAATTPILPEALEAWIAAQHDLAVQPGNPAALHAGGRRAKRMLEDARAEIGSLLGAERTEVVFTSGATESDALGVAAAARGVQARSPMRRRVLLSQVEHDAVGRQREALTREGFEVDRLPVSAVGVTVLDEGGFVESAAEIALASLVLVCSEIGTIQPVADLVRILGAGSGAPSADRPLIHTDAAQAVGILPLSFSGLGVDLASIGGHKIGAPVGTGVLLVRRGVPLRTDRPGGGHERGIRSGTPDVAGAVALGAALRASVARRDEWASRAALLRDRLLAGLPAGVRPTVALAPSSPAIIHLQVPTSHPEAVLMAMDAAGVHVSAGSACHAGVTRPSQILLDMGATEAEALGVLRISTGWETTENDIDAFLSALPRAIEAGRSLDARDTIRTGEGA